MADVTYRVAVEYETKSDATSKATQGLSKLDGFDKSLKSLKTGIGAATSSLGSFAGSAASAFEGLVEGAARAALSLAKIGAVSVAVAGVAAVTYGVTSLNNELEKTQIGFASIFKSSGMTDDFGLSMEAAAKVTADMRKDAAMLPGEFKDAAAIFQTIATTTLNQGASINDTRKLSGKIMTAAATTLLPKEQAAREFAELINVGMSSRNALGARFFGLQGGEREKFKKMSGAERLDYLTTKLDGQADAIKAYSQSYDGLSSTFRDNAKRFLGVATAPLFKEIKHALGSANTWFDQNEGKVTGWAMTIGEKLAAAFRFGVAMIKEWGPHLQAFALSAKAHIAQIWASPLVGKLLGLLGNALQHPGKSLGIAGGLYAGVKGAHLAGDMLPGLGMLSSLFGKGGIFAGLGVTLAPLLTLPVALAAVGIVAGGLVAIFFTAAGAISALTDTTSLFHGSATEAWTSIKKSLGATLDSLGGSFDKLSPTIVFVGQLVGTLALNYLATLASILETVASAVEMASKALGPFIRQLSGGNIDPDTAPKKSTWLADIKEAWAHHSWVDYGPQQQTASEKAIQQILDEQKDPNKTPPHMKGGGGVQVHKVEITISQNMDPYRVARVVGGHLADLSRYRKSSPFSPNFSARP